MANGPDNEDEAQYGQGRYGEVSRGGSEPSEPGVRAVRPEPEPAPDHPTPAEAFGAGLELAGADAEHSWDLVVDESGSLAAVEGTEMLGQDLAFGLDEAIRDRLGGRIQPDDYPDIERDVLDALEADPRIARALSVTARDAGSDTIGVEAAVGDEIGQRHELVIPLPSPGGAQ